MTYPSDKRWSSSVGMMNFPMYGKMNKQASGNRSPSHGETRKQRLGQTVQYSLWFTSKKNGQFMVVPLGCPMACLRYGIGSQAKWSLWHGPMLHPNPFVVKHTSWWLAKSAKNLEHDQKKSAHPNIIRYIYIYYIYIIYIIYILYIYILYYI